MINFRVKAAITLVCWNSEDVGTALTDLSCRIYSTGSRQIRKERKTLKFNILLNSAEDALVLVDKVSKYDCDVELISGCHHVDANLLWESWDWALRKGVLVVHDEPNDKIRHDLQKFIGCIMKEIVVDLYIRFPVKK